MVWMKRKALDYIVSSEIDNETPKDQKKLCLNSEKRQNR